jgi:ABC-type sugar transport system substrate-binding protein
LPPLTTVRQPLQEMGATATEFLLELAEGSATTPRRVNLATELVARESSAPPPESGRRARTGEPQEVPLHASGLAGSH